MKYTSQRARLGGQLGPIIIISEVLFSRLRHEAPWESKSPGNVSAHGRARLRLASVDIYTVQYAGRYSTLGDGGPSMADELKTRAELAAALKVALAKLSMAEQSYLLRALKGAVAERDVSRFKKVLRKLSIDEASSEYEFLMKLWDEMRRASLHD